ncbi:2',3'-cyclic-nucleotide 2'-phosphodiesterase / 3'-nucleotidase [Paenibacillus catalpae]|uniref:2',3'-cyclic-nucleotide 2'-phosphodiesterase / 3'-nucleotidase n=1 Tax=Paenibacillus catalpae TaxID=1045775 RepID=A0A1I1VIP2_9BACL|nr:bifunctional UDP-sugar hydrolase/5'-nucleotidase [Paenibacillus catalpae]SFD82719.1 2',3'-cyclic-nucleotide 2'-phosphodiesterase / 3'-nucleotidase [Paenibacillus catalpae]
MNRETMQCVILVTSDIHGYIHPLDYRTGEETSSGLAKLAALIKEERKKSPELLLIDNGDMLQGSPFAAYAAAYGAKVHPCIEVMNGLSYDAAVPGNHEFNFGLAKLRSAVSGSEFPWLAANIVSEREPAFGKPYLVKSIGGKLKVAILGVTTHYIPYWENPSHIAGLAFLDALESVKEWAAYIRKHEQPDLLIVSYHGGFERHLDTGQATERLTGENQAYAICMEVPGIDVLITGHQHRCLAGEWNGVAIVQTGCNGQALGQITVDAQRQEGRWEVSGKTVRLLEPGLHIAADEQVMALTEEVERRTQEWLDQPIGRTEGKLLIEDPFECRKAPHPFVQFIHQVQIEATGAELSVAALLSEESRGFEAIITMRDVLSAFVYPNTLRVLRLTGEDIRLALEQSAAYFDLGQDGRLKVSEDYLTPKAQHYNYDMWSGIEYDIDLSFPVGERITRLTRNGEELYRDAEYTVVMNSYRAGGGGNYDMFRGKPILYEGAADMAELAAEYIRSRGIIKAMDTDSWQIIW